MVVVNTSSIELLLQICEVSSSRDDVSTAHYQWLTGTHGHRGFFIFLLSKSKLRVPRYMVLAVCILRLKHKVHLRLRHEQIEIAVRAAAIFFI